LPSGSGSGFGRLGPVAVDAQSETKTGVSAIKAALSTALTTAEQQRARIRSAGFHGWFSDVVTGLRWKMKNRWLRD